MGVERKYTQCVSVILISRNTCAECHFVSHDLLCCMLCECWVCGASRLGARHRSVCPHLLMSCVCSVYFLGLVFSLWCLCVFCVVFFRTRRHYLIFHLGTEGSRGGDIIWVWSWWLFFHLSPCVRVLRHEPPSLPE